MLQIRDLQTQKTACNWPLDKKTTIVVFQLHPKLSIQRRHRKQILNVSQLTTKSMFVQAVFIEMSFLYQAFTNEIQRRREMLSS